MKSISVDVALCGVDCLLTDEAKDQIEDYLSHRWGTYVKVADTKEVNLDLVASNDSESDNATNHNRIYHAFKDSDVIIFGMRTFPMYALKSLVDTLQEMDRKITPIEVFAVVMDDEKSFKRFSHLSLYKREVPVYIHAR